MRESNPSQRWIYVAVAIVICLLIGLIAYFLLGLNQPGPASVGQSLAPPATLPTSTTPAPTVAPAADAIKVGWLVSQYIANSHFYGAGYHDHVTAIHPRFVDPKIELFALVEPDSLDNPAQKDIISRYFLPNHTLVITNPTDLAKMDVIVISRAFVLKPEDADAIDRAVTNGAGLLIHVGIDRYQGFSPTDRQLLQLPKPDDGEYIRAPIPCRVVSDHPLLSGLMSQLPAGELTISNLNGTIGEIHGEALIVAKSPAGNPRHPSSDPSTQPAWQMSPLYISRLGKGTIINCQWDSVPPQLVQASKGRFYLHCCEYLAHRPLD